MNNKQKREIIFASILGDGYISNEKNQHRLCIGHGKDQLDYLNWKISLINSTGKLKECNSINRSIVEFNGKKFVQYRAYWFGKKVLRLYYKRFYNRGHKTVAKVLKYLNSPLVLAMWFMDDGSVFKRKRRHKDGTEYFLRPSLKLCTHSYSKSDNEAILGWLEQTYGIKGYITIERKRNCIASPEYYTLNFNAGESLKIWNLIKTYVVQIRSMQKKFSYMIEYYG